MSKSFYYIEFNYNKHAEGILISRPKVLDAEVLADLNRVLDKYMPTSPESSYASEDEVQIILKNIAATPFGVLNALGSVGWELISQPDDFNNYYRLKYIREY